MNAIGFRCEPSVEESWFFRLREDDSITFSEYFSFGGTIDELAEELGADLHHEELELARAELADEGERIRRLQARLRRTSGMVNFESEAARREFQFAPVLFEASDITGARIYPEYQLNVSRRLHGSIYRFVTHSS